jgi:hypothetical protein
MTPFGTSFSLVALSSHLSLFFVDKFFYAQAIFEEAIVDNFT